MNAIRRHPWITLALSVLLVLVLWILFFVVFAESSGGTGVGPATG